MRQGSYLLYPVSWFIVARVVVYVALLLGPAFAAKWAEETFAGSLGPSARFLCQGLLLPIIYVGLHSLLRARDAPSHKFIYLVIGLYGFIAIGAYRRASASAVATTWGEFSLSVLLFMGFTLVAIRGARQNLAREHQRELRLREDAIAVQTEAILRAHEELERRSR